MTTSNTSDSTPRARNASERTPLALPCRIERGSAEWPKFAPAWADCASVEPDAATPAALTYTFERVWSVPSVLREVESFPVLAVRQAFEPGAAGLHEPGTPRVVLGDEGLWADYRAESVAELLHSIADALAPLSAAQRPAGPDTAAGAP